MSTKQRGLGRGLGALIDDFSAPETQQEVTRLPLQKVEPNPNQPRRRFDEEELQALSDSIAEHGILQPLAVRAMEGGFYQIIAGERRWRAARLAGLKEVPVVVVEADDRTVMELALIENLQRQDLNPMEEAEGYRVLTEEYGLTQEQAAARVGKSRPAVANALRLLALPEDVRSLVEKGEPLPFDIHNQVIYYAGPTPAPEGKPVGSIGPTTSVRMDACTPPLLERGLAGMIG